MTARPATVSHPSRLVHENVRKVECFGVGEKAREQALHELLLSLFNSRGLQIFVALRWPETIAHLPSASQSLQSTAYEVAQTIKQHGLIQDLFSNLTDAFPLRKEDIAAVAERWSEQMVRHPPPDAARASRAPESQMSFAESDAAELGECAAVATIHRRLLAGRKLRKKDANAFDVNRQRIVELAERFGLPASEQKQIADGLSGRNQAEDVAGLLKSGPEGRVSRFFLLGWSLRGFAFENSLPEGLPTRLGSKASLRDDALNAGVKEGLIETLFSEAETKDAEAVEFAITVLWILTGRDLPGFRYLGDA